MNKYTVKEREIRTFVGKGLRQRLLPENYENRMFYDICGETGILRTFAADEVDGHEDGLKGKALAEAYCALLNEA